MTLELVAGGEESCVGPAVPHRNPEPLAASHCYVRTPRRRGREEHERQEVGRSSDQRIGGVGPLGNSPEIPHLAIGGGVLHQAAYHSRSELERIGVTDTDGNAARGRAGLHYRNGLRVAALIHQVRVRRRLAAGGSSQLHGLRCGRGLVQHRRVGYLETGEVGHHRLEREQRLQPSLGDLGLVGSVRRVPSGILEHIAQHHRRREGAVVAHPDIGPEHGVLCPHGPERLEHLTLGPARRQRQRAAQPDVLRNYRVHQCIERVVTDRAEHCLEVGGAGTHVPRGKMGLPG